MDRLIVQAKVIEEYCLNHPVADELDYIHNNIKAAMFHLGSAHDQLAELMKENEGKCDD